MNVTYYCPMDGTPLQNEDRGIGYCSQCREWVGGETDETEDEDLD